MADDESRAVAAVTEPMAVEKLAPDVFQVITVSDAYRVDLRRDKGCTCADFEYREARCKHHRRAAIEADRTAVPALSFGVLDDVDERRALPDFESFDAEVNYA